MRVAAHTCTVNFKEQLTSHPGGRLNKIHTFNECLQAGLEKIMIYFKKIGFFLFKSDFFYLNQILLIFFYNSSMNHRHKYMVFM